MGLGASELARMNCTFGLARFGGTRFGCTEIPGPLLSIDGVNVTGHVAWDSVHWNEREGKAANRSDLDFQLHSTVGDPFLSAEGDRILSAEGDPIQSSEVGTIPTEGQVVKLRIGSKGTDVFRGHITNVRRANKNPGTSDDGKRWLCRCVDRTYFLNKKLVYGYYKSRKANKTVKALIDDFASGFTYDAVKYNAPVVGPYTWDFVPLSQCIQRIADDAGWYWYIDAEDDIHFYSTESQYSPQNLTESSSNFWDLDVEASGDQIKTQIVALGPPTTLTSRYDPADQEHLIYTNTDRIAPFEWLLNDEGSGTYTPYLMIGGELREFDTIDGDPKRIHFAVVDYLDLEYEIGEQVYPVMISESGSGARSAIEGGDGVHEFKVDLSDLPDMDSVEIVVNGILSDYDASRISGAYMTHDKAARAGAVVTINLPNWYDLASDDYPITEQQTSWPESRTQIQRRVKWGKQDKSFEELLAKAVG